ncbi:MAG TPA: FHA domain-containing protein, partial [Pyrinomonadaceae bacterium]
MKIVLAEDRGGKLLGERSFTSDLVLVGRDPAVCHYFFSQDEWPMVSRRHAEFRFAERRCLVADAKSRFGTFVDGQKVTGPVEVRVGSHVQLGTDGPILRVVSIEQAPAQAKVAPKPAELERMATVRDVPPAAAPPIPPAAPPSGVRAPKVPPPAAKPVGTPARLELVDPLSPQVRRFELNKEVTRLGRDPEGEVVIDAAAAV